MSGSLLNTVRIGQWEFHCIGLMDLPLYTDYIKATAYPANLWSASFAYLWAASRSRLRQILWRIVDGLLVTFGYSYKKTLYLFCLPFGAAGPRELAEVVLKCLHYCYEQNDWDYRRTLVRMINGSQLEFLQRYSGFDQAFRLATLQGIERHLAVAKVAALAGKEFATVRNKVNKFRRENPGVVVRRAQQDDYDALVELGRDWDSTAGRKYRRIFDRTYYREMISHSEELDQIILVVEKSGQIIGMVSGGILPTGQAWGGLLKYAGGMPGLSETLAVAFARELNRINPGVALLNIGSDLGPGGLREYKLKFRPVLNLKRYQMYLKKR